MSIEQIISNAPTVISVSANIVFAYLLQRRSIAVAEYAILEKTCARLRTELQGANQEVGRLKERTDLQPLLTAIQNWRDEGRNSFIAATAQLEENTKVLKTLIQSHQELMLQLLPNGAGVR